MARLVKDLRTCLKIYYTCPELGSEEIKELFGVSDTSACIMKKSVRRQQIVENVMVLDKHCVNTELAFKVWGIDIEDIERRVKKLEKLHLIDHGEAVTELVKFA